MGAGVQKVVSVSAACEKVPCCKASRAVTHTAIQMARSAIVALVESAIQRPCFRGAALPILRPFRVWKHVWVVRRGGRSMSSRLIAMPTASRSLAA